MRIALVCPYELRRPGGVRSHIAGLGAALVARGHTVEVIAPTDQTRLEDLDVIRCGRARTMAFGGTQIDLTWASRADLRRVNARGYDVVHFHTIWNPFVPFQIAAGVRGATVATFHDVQGPNTPAIAAAMMRPVAELIRRLALDDVIAVSPSVSRYLAVDHHTVIPNGLATPGELPAEGEREALLFIGRLEPRKGVDTLIDAVAKLGAHAPPLWIAGEGYLRGALEVKARALRLERVHFLGAVDEDEKWRLLRRAALLVAPSTGGESFGIVLLEAMAAGAPPIAAANPGYADVLRERGDDLLVPVGDSDALAARIRMLIDNPGKRAELRAWGERKARDYEWAAIAPRIEAVYARALSRTRNPA
jgi:phosphatidyl-myo-inositol alpha-mannosyltransferase